MKSWSCYVTLTLTSVVLKKITHEKGGKSNQAVSLHMRKGQRYILQNTIHSIVHWDTSTTLVPHVRENASHTCTHTHNIEHFPCLKFHHVKSHTVPRQFNGLHAKCTTHITETENEKNSKSIMHLDYTPQSTVLDFPKSNAPSVDCHMGQPDDCGHNQWWY